jgi:hypothetical protein
MKQLAQCLMLNNTVPLTMPPTPSQTPTRPPVTDKQTPVLTSVTATDAIAEVYQPLILQLYPIKPVIIVNICWPGVYGVH